MKSNHDQTLNDFQRWQLAFLSRLNQRFEQAPAEEILGWAVNNFGDGLALSTAFGASGMVLMDLALQVDPAVDIFFIDTGYFFAETYDLITRAEERYGRTFRRVLPEQSVAEQEQRYGPTLYHQDPDLCCHVRKVLPLAEALAGRTGWMSALRRDQSASRANTPILRWNGLHAVVKIAPLARWTEAQVWAYIRRHDLPYNGLHDRNYPSIGCWPCTRPVDPQTEDLRAGRWAGTAKTECGLHWPTTGGRTERNPAHP